MTDKNKSFKSQNATVLLLGMVALSGCNQVGGFDLATTGAVLTGNAAPAYKHTISEKVSVSDAFVALPADAGQVIEVAQTRYGNGVEQLVIYQGDSATRGENAALVRMAVHVDDNKRSESLKIGTSSVGRISSEIAEALPGVHMQMSNEVHTNAYGPFGYALGRAPGNVRCIYGWQQMKGNKNDRWAVFKRSSQKPRLSVRLRVCRAGITNEQLVGLMQNLQISADPAAVLRPTAVSWDAGPEGRPTGALPSYQRSGYVSQQREAYVESDYQSVRKPAVKRVKRVKPRRVVKMTHVVVEKPRVYTNSQPAVIYPAAPTNVAPRIVGNTIVPVPPQTYSDKNYLDKKPTDKPELKLKPAVTTPLVTARTYQPTIAKPVSTQTVVISKTPVAVSGRHSAVPLPY